MWHAKTERDKWTAFLLSLAVPGAGQMWSGSLWCLVWFLAVAAWGIAAHFSNLETVPGLHMAMLLGLGLLSAEHAKRLLEPSSTSKRKPARSHIVCRSNNKRAVRLDISVDFSMSQETLWRRIADLPRFLTIDPFHEQITMAQDKPAAGVGLTLYHNAFGWRFQRVSRILRWHAGHEYAFSDLSAKHPGQSFPHVYYILAETIEGDEQFQSRLLIRIRGKWTSNWIPTWLGLWWLRYVSWECARLLRKGLA